jgi:CubicO group peptidase (beta-lactamase class C family)
MPTRHTSVSMLRWCLYLLLLIGFSGSVSLALGEGGYPGTSWEEVRSPEALGWSKELWWVAMNGRHLPSVDLPGGTFSARGARGHYIFVVPNLDLVVVHRVNTDTPGREVTGAQFGEMMKLILAARIQQARK